MSPITPQSGLIRRYQLPGQSYNARGQLVRGVVVATYVTDDPNHPEAPDGEVDQRIPTAVYCDVLCYGNIPGLRYVALKQVLVAQGHGGMHDGRIWVPRAASVDITGASLDVDGPTEVAQMDGDHVLVAFLEGNPTEPIIIGGVPHPSRDPGNEERETGHRLRLKLADGNPSLVKHHGTFFGVLTNGDWICDTTFAHDGVLLTDEGERGFEPPQSSDSEARLGAQRYRLPPLAEQRTEWVDHTTEPDSPAVVSSRVDTTELSETKVQNTGTIIDELLDYADPEAPESVAHAKLTAALREVLIKDAGAIWRVILAEGANSLNLEATDADAILTLGDGAVAVAVADHLRTLYSSLRSKLNSFDSHTHQYVPAVHPAPTPTATTGPSATVSAPAWDTRIESTHLIIPDEPES